LTHGRFDHAALLPAIRQAYAPHVYAQSPFVGADTVVRDGQVFHTPNHSDDSICPYCQADGEIFVGDTTAVIRSVDGTQEDSPIRDLERLYALDVCAMNSGHGKPVTEGGKELIGVSLRTVRAGLRQRMTPGPN
jgi:glyoxylase-like metal-dependent hydrolase (beta-lactamase superfamily II)